MREILHDLDNLDSERVFLVRKIGSLGLSATRSLNLHFETQGTVERVLIPTSYAMSSCRSFVRRVRSPNLAFVVMQDAADVAQVIQQGHEQTIDGHKVLVEKHRQLKHQDESSDEEDMRMRSDLQKHSLADLSMSDEVSTRGSTSREDDSDSGTVTDPCEDLEESYTSHHKPEVPQVTKSSGQAKAHQDLRTMRDVLSELSSTPSERVLVVRKIGRLGGGAASILRLHFEAQGAVEQLLIPSSYVMSSCHGFVRRMRRSNLAFVVMEEAADVARVMQQGREQMIDGHMVHVGEHSPAKNTD